jgi:lipopolysaccharide/colanic/teichoic acid biosynthesis glycosyltransferase
LVKRCFDVSASAIGLIVLLPLILGVAVSVRLTSPGSVVFAQSRLGRHGRPFRMYKFRSMVVDADRRGARVTAGGDPRITPVGRILRRTKLDEVPQLWNVLKGDMSLVGPRPEVPEFAAMFPRQYQRILNVRPGITHRTTLAFRSEEAILADEQVREPRRFYIDRVMPRKLAMYEECLEDPLLRDIWTILETVSPWKSTPAMTAEQLLDAPLVANVPAWYEPAAMPQRSVVAQRVARPAPARLVAVPTLASVAVGGGRAGDDADEAVEELLQYLASQS